MGVKILVLCLLYEIIAISSYAALKLPLKELVATVKPIKPKPLAPGLPTRTTSTPAAPKVPSSDDVLAYFKSQYRETETSEIKCEFSSPLVLTSTSRPAPVHKIEGFNTIDEPKTLNCLNDQSELRLPIVPSVAEATKCNTKRESVLTAEMFLPCNVSPKLGTSFIPILTVPTAETYPSFNHDNLYPCVSSAAIKSTASSLFLSDISGITPNSVMSLPSITSLPIVSLDPLGRMTNHFVAIPPPYTRGSSPYSSSPQLTMPALSPYNRIPFGTLASLNPSYAIPYPLRYSVMSLPAVVIPSNINPTMTYADSKNSNNPFKTVQQSTSSPLCFENPYLSRGTSKISPSRVRDTPYGLNAYSNNNVPKSTLEYQLYKSPQPDSLLTNSIKSVTVDPCSSLYPSEFTAPSSNINDLFSNTRAPDFLCNPSLSLSETVPFDFVSPSFEFDSSNFFDSDCNRNVEYPNDYVVPDYMATVNTILNEMDCDICNDMSTFQAGISVYPKEPEFTESVPCFIPIEDICTDNVVPQLCSMPLETDEYYLNTPTNMPVPLQVNSIPETPQIYSSPISLPKLPQTSTVPSTYINVSPTYTLSQSTPKAISEMNNIVSDITKNILSTFMSYLPTLAKQQVNIPRNTYAARKRKPKRIRPSASTCPSAKLLNNIPSVSALPQMSSSPIISSIDSLSAPTKIFLEPVSDTFESFSLPTPITSPTVVNMPTFVEDFPSTSFISYQPVVELMPITESPPLAPVKLTLIPPASLADYSSPRPCLSELPSPIIPSYFEISPFEPQVKKLGKNTKTIEKLLELVFLTELINGDTYVDWDALDTVLTILFAD